MTTAPPTTAEPSSSTTRPPTTTRPAYNHDHRPAAGSHHGLADHNGTDHGRADHGRADHGRADHAAAPTTAAPTTAPPTTAPPTTVAAEPATTEALTTTAPADHHLTPRGHATEPHRWLLYHRPSVASSHQEAPSCPTPSSWGSPWRMDYIRRGSGRTTVPACLCDLPAADPSQDEANHLLARGKVSFVPWNAFPYNPGHLTAPYRHVGDFVELTTEELAELMAFTGQAIWAMREESGPHGFNLGMNLGQVAGAASPTTRTRTWRPAGAVTLNFMPVVGQTKVLPELLAETGPPPVPTSRAATYVPVFSSWRWVTMINPTE